MAKIIYWAPRLFGIIGILFISVFALDVFEPGVPPLEIAIGLFVHLLPSLALVVLLAFAWVFELVGGILFLLVGLLIVAYLSNAMWVNLMLAAPFLATGFLFLLSHIRQEVGGLRR
jgi:hypothetical protein